jgi:hypothetical protein
MYIVVMRCFRVTIFAVEISKRTYSECVFAASVIQHAPCYIANCGLFGRTRFPHIMIFREKCIDMQLVFCLSLQFLSETFIIPRRTEPHFILNVDRSS